jgi:hypothetical protein
MSIEYEINKDPIDLGPIIDSQNNNNLANMASNQTLFLANRDAIERVGLGTIDIVSKANNDIIACIERNGTSSVLSVEKIRGDVLISLEKNTGDLKTSIYDVTNNIQLSQEKMIGDTRQIVLENYNNQITLSKEIQLDLCKLTEKLTLQATENVSKVELCVNNVNHNIDIQIANISSTIHLEALNNIKVLSAQMIECCCELKEMMTATTNATHQLIREMESNRMKDALQNANMEIMMKKYKE